MVALVESATAKPAHVKAVWRIARGIPCPEWTQGAIDAYHGVRPQRASEKYWKGYKEQLLELPADDSGRVEWFRRMPEGGWKLTDNI